MKNILVPMDFSACAKNAAKVAINVAKKSSAEITLLHVLDYSAGINSVSEIGINEALLTDLYLRLRKEGTEKMSVFLASLDTQDITVHSKIETGLPRDIIARHIDTGEHDLIVMGTKGSSGVAELLVGSTTERIVRESTIPVLTVSDVGYGFDPDEIVYASDFEERSGENFEDVIAFAKLFDAKIKLVRINTPQDFANTIYAEKLMQDFAERWKLENFTLDQFDYEMFEAGLGKYVRYSGGDMIAIGTHGRNGFSHFFHGGSKAEDVVNHFKVPVLTFKIS